MPGKLGGDLLDCFSVHGAILDVFSGTEGIEADVLRVVRRVDVLLHAAETDDRSAEGRRFYAGDPATLANQSQPEEDPRRRAACAQRRLQPHPMLQRTAHRRVGRIYAAFSSSMAGSFESGTSICNRNRIMTGVRFLFRGRPPLGAQRTRKRQDRQRWGTSLLTIPPRNSTTRIAQDSNHHPPRQRPAPRL